jgi:hypothetical protein
VPRVSLCSIESDAIAQSESVDILPATKVPLPLDSGLQSNVSTSPELKINSPTSSSDVSSDTSLDGSADSPPEARPFIPDGSLAYYSSSQITFNVADPLLTRNCSHPCWSIWQRARPWLRSRGYRLYEDDAPIDARPPPLNACTASQYPYGVFSTDSTLCAYSQVRWYVLVIEPRRDDSDSRAK